MIHLFKWLLIAVTWPFIPGKAEVLHYLLQVPAGRPKDGGLGFDVHGRFPQDDDRPSLRDLQTLIAIIPLPRNEFLGYCRDVPPGQLPVL